MKFKVTMEVESSDLSKLTYAAEREGWKLQHIDVLENESLSVSPSTKARRKKQGERDHSDETIYHRTRKHWSREEVIILEAHIDFSRQFNNDNGYQDAPWKNNEEAQKLWDPSNPKFMGRTQSAVESQKWNILNPGRNRDGEAK